MRKEVCKMKNLEDIWKEQLEKCKEQSAIIYNGRVWSYYDVDIKSSTIAANLLKKTKSPYVGVHMNNSDEYVICILGILKAGKIFVPIDQQYPAERKIKIVENCKIDIVISDEMIHKFDCCEFVFFSDISSGDIEQFIWRESRDAYVMHTSGSTGEPKGILIEKNSLVNLIKWFGQTFSCNKNKNMVKLSRNSFDVSIEEIFGCLFNEGTLFIPEDRIRMHKKRLRKYLDENEINIVQVVPTLLRELFDEVEKIESVKIIICGGESLSEELKNSILKKGYILYNNYGPTETTVDAMCSKCELDSPVNLGRSISNSSYVVLNEQNQRMDKNSEGELCILGVNLAREYINQPKLTEEKFPILNGHRMYRTGDLVWIDELGRVIYKGRIDNQVKFHGQRIELEEIEKAFNDICSASNCCALFFHNAFKQRIVMFYEGSVKEEVSAIRKKLEEKVPEYMIPSEFILVQKLPETANGKIDRNQLKDMFECQYISKDTSDISACQYDDLSKRIVQIMIEVLGTSKEDINFELGFSEQGIDSMEYVNLIIRIEDENDIELNDDFLLPSNFHTIHDFVLGVYSQITKSERVR